jgi:hypothetical protein
MPADPATSSPSDPVPELIAGVGLLLLVFLGVATSSSPTPLAAPSARLNALRGRPDAASRGALGKQLLALRPQLAAAAQTVVDVWEQNEEGEDDELGTGGLCDRVADAMRGVLDGLGDDVSVTDGGQDGSDHNYLVVHNTTEAYEVDVPPGVYETGGGYSWHKIEGATIEPEDVVVEAIPRSWIEETV